MKYKPFKNYQNEQLHNVFQIFFPFNHRFSDYAIYKRVTLLTLSVVDATFVDTMHVVRLMHEIFVLQYYNILSVLQARR